MSSQSLRYWTGRKRRENSTPVIKPKVNPLHANDHETDCHMHRHGGKYSGSTHSIRFGHTPNISVQDSDRSSLPSKGEPITLLSSSLMDAGDVGVVPSLDFCSYKQISHTIQSPKGHTEVSRGMITHHLLSERALQGLALLSTEQRRALRSSISTTTTTTNTNTTLECLLLPSLTLHKCQNYNTAWEDIMHVLYIHLGGSTICYKHI